MRLTVIPELSLLARAHAPQVSLVTRDTRGVETTLPDAYDDGEFQELFSRLDHIDRLLPDDQSISDFVRERPTFGKGTLETDSGLIRDGMIHLIRTLKPRDGLWLEQMVTHGNLTLHSSIPGGTDIVKEGVTYNVVRILLEYQKYIRNFQLRQTELRKIRRSTQKWSLREPYIPRESTAFPEIAPTRREAMRELQKEISETRTYEELMRILSSSLSGAFSIDKLTAGAVGISESGLIMTPTERLMDLAGWVGNIILYTIIMRVIWIGVKWVGLWLEQIAWLQKVVSQYFPKVTRMTDAIRTLRPKVSR